MFILQVEGDFASAHQLRGYQGKCENLHGHNWRVRAKIRGKELDRLGMLVDFGVFKQLLKESLERLDHHFLNETPPFDRVNPTSENIAKYLFETLSTALPDGVSVHEVTVWESEKCAATYLAD